MDATPYRELFVETPVSGCQPTGHVFVFGKRRCSCGQVESPPYRGPLVTYGRIGDRG